MSVLVDAVIGVGGAAIGAVVTTFGPDVMRRVRRRSANSVGGSWTGAWSIDWPPEKRRDLKDSLALKVDAKGVISGEGTVPDVGQYKIHGRDSLFCATLVFCGVHHRESLAGTILLKKGTVLDALDGVWCQLADDGTLLGGTVKLTRLR